MKKEYTVIPTPQREEIGTDALEQSVSTLVNLGEALANADSNKDGKVSVSEVFGVVTMHTGSILGIIQGMPAAVAESKDITIKEASTVLIVAVEEIDNLTDAQKAWIKDTLYHASELAMNVLRAKDVFGKAV